MAERLLSFRVTTRSTSKETPGSPPESVRSSLSQAHVVEGGPSTISRSRGSLAVQSPEMLCLTARTDEAAKSLKDALSRPSAPLSTPTPSLCLKPTFPASDDIGSDLDSATISSTDKAQVPCLAPGQRRGSNVTRKAFPAPSAASDVWSLGCLLVELVSGTAERSLSVIYLVKFYPIRT
jgi:serine/threonine protein kinase